MANSTHEMVNIADAFERHKEGKSKNLYVLMNQLKDPTLPKSHLLAYLLQLRRLVAALDKEFEILVGFILKMDWSSRELEVIDEYLLLVKNIVSVHTFYLSASLKMIVDHLKPRNYDPAAEVTEEMREKNAGIFSRLHTLLAGICKTIPMTPVVLLPFLTDSFPFYLVDDYIQECYVSNLLSMTAYLPKHRVQILQLIISEMTKIDVHARVEDSRLSHDSEECSEDVEADPVRRKLDHLMSLMLSYIKDVCYVNGTFEMAQSQKLLGDLLDIFETVLLPTYASHFVQFIIFYICSFHESFATEFLERLWKKFEDPNVQTIFRQVAVLYIASYLVRAKKIATSTVKIYVDTLVAWVRRYIQHSPQNSRPDVRRHGPFYSACQAVFYIFIYRHEELLHCYGLKYCEGLYLGSVATSWLNPLRVCMPQVATKFASVVRNTRVAFCDTVIDRNRRYQLPEVNSVLDDGGAAALGRHIDTFFPFDPFTLPRSSPYVVDVYRNVESLYAEKRHRTLSEDVKEEELFMDCDENVDSVNICDFKLYGTSPGVRR